MIVPDINVLLYAYVTAFPAQSKAQRWWESVLRRGDPVGIAPPVAFGFVRIATSRRALTRPMALDRATQLVEEWLALPNVQLLRPGPRHLQIGFELLRSAGTARDLTTDAQIAAYAIESRGTVYTADGDFARFAGLRVIDPLAA